MTTHTTSITPLVLIAEDDPAIAGVLTFLLEDARLRVALARDGDEAVAMLDRLAPDLFVLDVMMPGRDGFAVAREVRARPEHDRAHILFLTARGDATSRRQGYADGAEQYVAKPFDNHDLLARIDELLAVSSK